MVQGFGDDVPLGFAVRQIVPKAVKVRYGSGADPTDLVTWKGGQAWNRVLTAAVQPLGLWAGYEPGRRRDQKLAPFAENGGSLVPDDARPAMPNLEAVPVRAWFDEWNPPRSRADWPPAIRPLETAAGAPTRLAQLGQALEAAAEAQPARLASALQESPLRDQFAAVAAQLGSARLFRILHWLAEQDLPDLYRITGALIEYDGPNGRALRAAIQAVLRRATLERMFAPERLAALQTACATPIPEAP